MKVRKSKFEKDVKTVNQFDVWLNEIIKPQMEKDIQAIKEEMPSEFPELSKKKAMAMYSATTEYEIIRKQEKLFEDSLKIMRKYLDINK